MIEDLRLKRRKIILLLLSLLLFCLARAADVIQVDNIRPGMKGFGLTVFSGHKIERFEVEVLDVMHKIAPKCDLILCRLSGANLEKTGVIAGMSGSPVYLEVGATHASPSLAGAVAYAWGFSKEPIAGVTPINEMLEIWQEKRPGTNSGIGLEKNRSTAFSPLPIPVALSGFTPGLADLIEPIMSKYGLVPIAASGRARETDSAGLDSLLIPGAAIGVGLIDGDVRMSGIGTLTYRQGQKILAFGHPMLQAGSVKMPLVGGVIHSILPSLSVSFKFFSPTIPIGTLTQDRLTGIAGTIGPVPEMTPVEVAINSRCTEDTYHFRVAKHPTLLPILIPVGLSDIIFSTEGKLEDMTLSSQMGITLDDTENITVHHVYTGEGLASRLFHNTSDELNALFEKRFPTPKLTRVVFKLKYVPGRKKLRIISARPDRLVAKPGDTITVAMVLEDYAGKKTNRIIKTVLPKTTPAGRLTLVISPWDSLQQREALRAPGVASPNTMKGLKKLLENTGRENELVVAGFIPKPGITMRDKELPAPPPSLRSTIMASGSTEPVLATNESPLFEQSFYFDAVISGTYELRLEVHR